MGIGAKIHPTARYRYDIKLLPASVKDTISYHGKCGIVWDVFTMQSQLIRQYELEILRQSNEPINRSDSLFDGRN